MADGLKFSSEEMYNLANNVSNLEKQYSEKIAEMNSLITDLNASGIWTSGETETYEEFKSLWDGKKPSLDKGDELMIEFKNGIIGYSDAFVEKSDDSKRLYQ